MGTFREWTTIWSLASARTRAVAVLLMFGTIQAGFAVMFLDIGFRERGESTAANLRGASVMGSIGLLSFFTGVFLAASKIFRTSQNLDDRNRRMKALARTAGWYALIGPFDLLLHGVADLPALHHVILIAGGFGLLHLTVKVSLLLERQSPGVAGVVLVPQSVWSLRTRGGRPRALPDAAACRDSLRSSRRSGFGHREPPQVNPDPEV